MAQGIREMRNSLAAVGETFTDVRSDVEILAVGGSADEPTLTVRENTRMYYTKVHGDEPEFTSYGAEHTFQYRRTDSGKWVLLNDLQHDPSGLLPLWKAERFAGSSRKLEQAPPAADLAGVPVADVARPSFGVQEPGLRTSAGLAAPERSKRALAGAVAAGGYNYSAMATYLERYCGESPCGGYNPNYRTFNGVGGDCTNFASQALRAGGWTDDYGWYRSSENWWYGSSNQTWSWINVDYWASFAYTYSGRVTPLTNVWYLGVGDVLQVDASKDGTKNHTMMVSYRSSTTPYFTYHSSNRYRRSLNLVLQDWGASNYYAWRT